MISFETFVKTEIYCCVVRTTISIYFNSQISFPLC